MISYLMISYSVLMIAMITYLTRSYSLAKPSSPGGPGGASGGGPYGDAKGGGDATGGGGVFLMIAHRMLRFFSGCNRIHSTPSWNCAIKIRAGDCQKRAARHTSSGSKRQPRLAGQAVAQAAAAGS